jgi:hypothetical protein
MTASTMLTCYLQEMQDKIRENLRKEWGASSESDDAWEASVTDVVLKKQMSKKYKLSPSGKQNALQLYVPPHTSS